MAPRPVADQFRGGDPLGLLRHAQDDFDVLGVQGTVVYLVLTGPGAQPCQGLALPEEVEEFVGDGPYPLLGASRNRRRYTSARR